MTAAIIKLRLLISILLLFVACSGYDGWRFSLNCAAYNRRRNRSFGMRSLVPAALLAFAMPATAQLLTCPAPATSTRACELFHYHVAMYRPDTRGFAEVWGTNQFASQAACDRARDAAIKRNLA